MLFTAVPKPKIDFVREMVTKLGPKPERIFNIEDIKIISNSRESFWMNMEKYMTEDNNIEIEYHTRGQNTNELWFTCRKGVITGSKGHEVKTKMSKVKKGGGG